MASGPRGVEVERRAKAPLHPERASSAPGPLHKAAREQVRGVLAPHTRVQTSSRALGAGHLF